MTQKNNEFGAYAAGLLLVFGITFFVMHAGIREGRGFFDKDQGVATMAMSMAGFAFAVVSAVLLIRTLRATQKANDIALQSGEAQMRAYLVFTEATAVCWRNVDDGTVCMEVATTLANSGQSPAIHPQLILRLTHRFLNHEFNYETSHGRPLADIPAKVDSVPLKHTFRFELADRHEANWQMSELTATCVAKDVFEKDIGTLSIFRIDNRNERHFQHDGPMNRVVTSLLD